MPGKESKTEQKAKYLLVDWLSAAGYEAPAVILVTDDFNRLKNATYCQRAKAKLTIYIAKDPRRKYRHLSRAQYLKHLNSRSKAHWVVLAIAAILAVIGAIIYGLYSWCECTTCTGNNEACTWLIARIVMAITFFMIFALYVVFTIKAAFQDHGAQPLRHRNHHARQRHGPSAR